MARLSRTTEPQDYKTLQASAFSMNEQNDCAVKAVAVACDVPYVVAHTALKAAGRKDRQGTYSHLTHAAIEALGFRVRIWTFRERRAMVATYPGAHKGLVGITTHHPRRFPQAWANCHPNMLFFSQRHVLAVKEGIVRDYSINKALRVIDIWEVEKV